VHSHREPQAIAVGVGIVNGQSAPPSLARRTGTHVGPSVAIPGETELAHDVEAVVNATARTNRRNRVGGRRGNIGAASSRTVPHLRARSQRAIPLPVVVRSFARTGTSTAVAKVGSKGCSRWRECH
jgi:hypothetical protein